MIQINDNDLPITAAEKIISGTKEVTASPLDKAVSRMCGDIRENIDTVQYDMFDLEDLKEIAEYLTIYYESESKRMRRKNDKNN